MTMNNSYSYSSVNTYDIFVMNMVEVKMFY